MTYGPIIIQDMTISTLYKISTICGALQDSWSRSCMLPWSWSPQKVVSCMCLLPPAASSA